MNNEDSFSLHYNSDAISLKQPWTSSFLQSLIQSNALQQLTPADYQRLQAFLPEGMAVASPDDILNILSTKRKMESPIELFSKMLQRGFFSEDYQSYRKAYETECIQACLSQYKSTLRTLSKYQKAFEGNDVTDHNQYALNHLVTFDMRSELASSGYSSVDSDREDGGFSMNNDNNAIDDAKSSDKERNFSKFGIGISFNERFKGLKKNKNQITIRRRTVEEKKDYQKQEAERYKSPSLPWEYTCPNGMKAIVAPLLKKMKMNQQKSKPREHAMLKAERPSYITILSLVRDAAARLTDGVGTRADICDLLKDSQYINEHLHDSQLNNIVSGALDRLHYENDPCVQYNQHRKLWIYLHLNRTLDYPYWNEQMKKGMNEEETEELNVDMKEYDGNQPITMEISPSSISTMKKKDTLLKKKHAGRSMIYAKPKKKHKYQ